MNNQSTKVYFPLVIVFILLFMVLSLIVILINSEFKFIPNWLPQALFTGIFTLIGAYLGASQAGKYTLKSVKEQISFEKAMKIEEEHKKSYRSLRLFSNELIFLITLIKQLENYLENDEQRVYQVMLSQYILERAEIINNLLADNNLMMNISNDKFHSAVFLRILMEDLISVCEDIKQQDYLIKDAKQLDMNKGYLNSRRREIENIYEKIND